jgi:hypothetical protein
MLINWMFVISMLTSFLFSGEPGFECADSISVRIRSQYESQDSLILQASFYGPRSCSLSIEKQVQFYGVSISSLQRGGGRLEAKNYGDLGSEAFIEGGPKEYWKHLQKTPLLKEDGIQFDYYARFFILTVEKDLITQKSKIRTGSVIWHPDSLYQKLDSVRARGPTP